MKNAFEQILIERLSKGDKKAFSSIFEFYYKDLVIFANTFTKDLPAAEEIVQDTFVRLWEQHDSLSIYSSLKSFLLKSVQNRCLDEIRHQKVREGYRIESGMNRLLYENDTENYIFYSDLEHHLDTMLGSLPHEIAETFRMSRIEGLRYQDIAQHFNVSVRTVEVRISKALQWLYRAFKDIYYLVIFL